MEVRILPAPPSFGFPGVSHRRGDHLTDQFMKTENVDTLVLGAGPSGLAAGYTLAKAGLNPVVLEKDKVPGGLMRSIRHGDFHLRYWPQGTLQSTGEG